MYRKYPKRQDHGSRGTKTEAIIHWSYWKKGMKLVVHDQLQRERSKVKVELNKLKLCHEDEDIEEFLRRTQFVPCCEPWDFD